MDFVVGIAIYFALNAFVPVLSTNATVVITLFITAIFAEFIETRLKRISKEDN